MGWLLTYLIIMSENVSFFFCFCTIVTSLFSIGCIIGAFVSFVDSCSCDPTKVDESDFCYHWWKHKKWYWVPVIFLIISCMLPSTKQIFQIVGVKKGYDIMTSETIQSKGLDAAEKGYEAFMSTMDKVIDENVTKNKEE